jgi:hypothetical protein
MRQEGDAVEATVAVYPDGIAALSAAFENPGARESLLFFQRLGHLAAKRLYVNAAKEGFLDE